MEIDMLTGLSEYIYDVNHVARFMDSYHRLDYTEVSDHDLDDLKYMCEHWLITSTHGHIKLTSIGHEVYEKVVELEDKINNLTRGKYSLVNMLNMHWLSALARIVESHSYLKHSKDPLSDDIIYWADPDIGINGDYILEMKEVGMIDVDSDGAIIVTPAALDVASFVEDISETIVKSSLTDDEYYPFILSYSYEE